MPVIASRLSRGKVHLHGWMYKIETGEVFAFDPEIRQFMPLVSIRGAVKNGAGEQARYAVAQNGK
jgi:hypothetical protein